MRCEFGRRWIWVSCGSQQGMRMIGLDWLILDWCIGCFWETNMERAYHTSKTLKVNYVHHASFWWNHYIIHINRPKKLSQVSPNWPMPFQTYRFYWSIEVQDLNFRLQWYWWHCEVGKLKILAWFLHIGDKTRIVSTCSPLNSCVLFLLYQMRPFPSFKRRTHVFEWTTHTWQTQIVWECCLNSYNFGRLVISMIFRLTSGQTSDEKNFRKNFYCLKRSAVKFHAESWGSF